MGSLGGEARGGGSGSLMARSVRGEGGGSAVLRLGGLWRGLLVGSRSIGIHDPSAATCLGGVIQPQPAQQVPKGK